MSERRNAEIFSFSFLDVIACGVGAIFFVTILVIAQSTMGIGAETQKLLRESIQYRTTIERLENEMNSWGEDSEKWNNLMKQREQLNELRSKLHAASTAADNNAKAAQERAQLEAELARLNQQAASLQKLSGVISRRRPALRKTDKIDSLYLSFHGGGRFRVARRLSLTSFSSDHYEIMDLGDATILKAKHDGITVEETLRTGGIVAQIVRTLDPNQHYVECYVENDAFEDFVSV